MVGLTIVLCVVLFFMLLFLGISFYAYCQAFYVNKNKLVNISKLTNLQLNDVELEKIIELVDNFKNDKYENVSIKSFDGITLNAKYYEYKEGAPLQIMFHGYRSIGDRDFAGGMNLAKRFEHNVLMIEQRGHGRSKKTTTTLGVLEKYDCLYWVRYAVERFGNELKIILSGVSMGASTVLMATDLKLPSNVIGIIADSPFSSPNDIVEKVVEDRKMPVRIVMPFVKIGALIFGGFEFKSEGAVNSVKNNKIPVLIIHGDADTFVPSYMSKEIYYNCSSKKKLFIFKNANHCKSYLIEEERYIAIVREFLDEIF